jgi:uncharacterized iron-regulated protein
MTENIVSSAVQEEMAKKIAKYEARHNDLEALLLRGCIH